MATTARHIFFYEGNTIAKRYFSLLKTFRPPHTVTHTHTHTRRSLFVFQRNIQIKMNLQTELEMEAEEMAK